MSIRVGAVGYLNARPLTWALDRSPRQWNVRYDLPAVCAALLRERQIDLGLIPSIEYLQAPDYRMVPGIGIGAFGPVASVALYTRGPLEAVRRIALDTSSRTSVTLIRVLCRHRFGLSPEFVPHGPDLAAMTRDYDAGLLIGDPAFDVDHVGLGLHKIDLGEEWTAMTGLPFVFAAWTGRPDAVTAEDVGALQEARDEGLASVEAIAREYADTRSTVEAERAAIAVRAAAYLRDNVKYGLGPREVQGLQLFLDYAVELGLAPARRVLEFF